MCQVQLSRTPRYSVTGIGVAACCDERVCLSVCLSVHLSLRQHISRNYTSDLHLEFRVTYGRGSVLLWRRCDRCTSGFMDDVICARSGPNAGMSIDASAASDVITSSWAC